MYTISIGILCVSLEELSLAESNKQIYMTSTSELFLKRKDIVNICKVNFCFSKLFSQCNTGELLCAQVLFLYLYVCVSLLVPVFPVSVCLCV